MKISTDNKSKIIAKKIIHKSKYFQLENVTFIRNEKTFTKDIIRRTPTVIVLPIDAEDNMFLVSQFRDSMQEALLEVVAGHMEPGETPLESAKNELQQETGLTAEKWKQISSFYVSANMDAVVHIFYATGLTKGKQDLDDDEDIEIIKLPFGKVLEKIEAGEIRVSSNIAALLLLDKLRREGKV